MDVIAEVKVDVRRLKLLPSGFDSQCYTVLCCVWQTISEPSSSHLLRKHLEVWMVRLVCVMGWDPGETSVCNLTCCDHSSAKWQERRKPELGEGPDRRWVRTSELWARGEPRLNTVFYTLIRFHTHNVHFTTSFSSVFIPDLRIIISLLIGRLWDPMFLQNLRDEETWTRAARSWWKCTSL